VILDTPPLLFSRTRLFSHRCMRDHVDRGGSDPIRPQSRHAVLCENNRVAENSNGGVSRITQLKPSETRRCSTSPDACSGVPADSSPGFRRHEVEIRPFNTPHALLEGSLREKKIGEAGRLLALEHIVHDGSTEIEIGEQNGLFQLRCARARLMALKVLPSAETRWLPRWCADPADSACDSAGPQTAEFLTWNLVRRSMSIRCASGAGGTE